MSVNRSVTWRRLPWIVVVLIVLLVVVWVALSGRLPHPSSKPEVPLVPPPSKRLGPPSEALPWHHDNLP